MATGCSLIKVESGNGAVSRAQRETFDTAVLVSTGKDMDLTETVLNLRDITKTMKILVVVDCGKEDKEPVRTAARALPNTAIVTLDELRECLQSGKSKIEGPPAVATGNRGK
ncbi:MAG: hypothetical protein ACREQW_08930 [Candidatus Binatia bacterium]